MQETPKLLDLNGLEQYNDRIQGQVGNLWTRVNEIDDHSQTRMQFYEMPEAEDYLVNQVYQYIGDTDNTYTNGYFYKCVENYDQTLGEIVYNWEQIDVQPASSSGGGVIGDDTYGRSSSSPAIFDIMSKDVGVYAPAYLPMYIRMKQYESSSGNMDLQIFDNIIVFKKYSDASANDKLAYTVIYNQYSSNHYVGVYIIKNSSGDGINWTSATDVNNANPYYAMTSVPTYISSDWTFQYVPSCGSQPTYTGHLTNKEYVDTHLLKELGINAFSSTTSYSVGDYVYKSSSNNYIIYKCNTATSGSWVAANWTQKTLLEYLNDKLVGTALNASY